MKSVTPARAKRAHWSPPSRGAWIEINASLAAAKAFSVAPLAGGVD